jgi:hypothetical protein
LASKCIWSKIHQVSVSLSSDILQTPAQQDTVAGRLSLDEFRIEAKSNVAPLEKYRADNRRGKL